MPRAISAQHRVAPLGAGQPRVEQPLADAPLLERRRARPAARRSTSSSQSPTLMPSRWRRNARTGCSTKRTRSSSSTTVRRRSRQRRRRGSGRRRGARPRQRRARPSSVTRSKLHGLRRRARRRRSCAGRTAAADAGRRRVARRSTTSSSSPTGTAGGRGEVRALVVAGVGDDQAVGRGHQRVEQQLAVLAARVALADVRVVEHRSSPSRGALRGKTPSSRPSRQTTRCGTERIGTSVQIVRWPVRKFARVGRPCSRSASSARTSAQRERASRAPAASRDHVVEQPLRARRAARRRAAAWR